MSEEIEFIDREIGRGGYGTVYTVKDMPEIVIKKSSKNSTCRTWSDEFKKIKLLVKNIKKSAECLDIYESLKMVRILEPEKFIEDDFKNCYTVMKRIYRPEGRDVFEPTLQALLGENDKNMIYKGRGQFIGISDIKKYVSDDNIETASYELGIMMGLIHFVGKNDGYDLEVFLGKEYNSKISRFYIADFDLSENITEYDKDTIERIVWSMAAVEYFPRSNNKKLLDLFLKGYALIAKIKGIDDDIIQIILDEYLTY